MRYPWYVRLIFRLQRRNYGEALEPSRLWGRTPRVFLALSALYGALDRKSSPLPPGLRSLVQVRVSQMNGCSFCTDINSASGVKRGIAPEKLLALHAFRESPLFTEKEKAALQHAEMMTGNLPGDRETMIARPPRALQRRRNRRADGADRVPEPVLQVQRGAGRSLAGLLYSARTADLKFSVEELRDLI